MPAPVPIDFAGDIGAQGELALRAGAAQARRQDFQQQQSRDMSFLRDEFARRERGNANEANFRLQQAAQVRQQNNQTRAFALQDAAQRLRGRQPASQASGPGVSAPEAPERALGLGRARQSIGEASITTERGTFSTGLDGTVERQSPQHGQELVDPVTGGFNRSNLPDEFRDPGSLVRDRAIAGGGFVRAGRGTGREHLPMTAVQQMQVLDEATLGDQDRQLLQQAVQAGGMTTNQLLTAIASREPKANDPRKVAGRTLDDNLAEIDILQRQRNSMAARFVGDAEGDALLADIDRQLAQKREDVTRQRAIADAPQMSGRSLSNPLTNDAGGQPITREMAIQFLQQAGGDPARARQMAREAGFVLPQ